MGKLLYEDQTYQLIGICIQIHKTMGMGLKEINYKDAMEIDFTEFNIPFEREKKFRISYKGKTLNNPYYADFIVHDSIIIEVKSASQLIEQHSAQTLSYLSVSGLKLALLINFGERSLTWKRIIL